MPGAKGSSQRVGRQDVKLAEEAQGSKAAQMIESASRSSTNHGDGVFDAATSTFHGVLDLELCNCLRRPMCIGSSWMTRRVAVE